jgi:hypothetical protein
VLIERREDARGQLWRAAAINQLEQLVQINLTLASDPFGDITGKTCAAQAPRPPLLPPRPITGRIL